jgi:TolB-like protein/class 3 adenylate cyclase
MFTDIVGYSAITQRDESLALALLDEHNRLLHEVIVSHGGKVVKTVGDAFLAEFPSALDAVKAAIAAQSRLHTRNTANHGEPIYIRIGIHLGDVVYRDGDVFGDGVNIAARIQSVAVAEGICISGDVAGQVENKIGLPLVPMGTPKLKNIGRAIPVYSVKMPWTTGRQTEARYFASSSVASKRRIIVGGSVVTMLIVIAAIWTALAMRKAELPALRADVSQPSLAVLPFVDLSQTRDQEYLGDGLAEEILNQLSQVPALRIIGRTSSFSFRGKSEDLRAIGAKLGVGHLLEGSIRKDGTQLRITAKLIRADDGTPVWSKTFARELQDVFTIQDEIARDVATALSIKLDAGDLTRAAGGTTDVAAYEKFLQARSLQASGGLSNMEKSSALFREAVALDPQFGVSWVALVQNLYDLSGRQFGSTTASREIEEIVARLSSAAPDAPWTLHLQAYDHLTHYRWGEADKAARAVLKTPYGSRRIVDPWANPPIDLKWVWLFNVGRASEAVKLARDWVQTDPLSLYASNSYLQQLQFTGTEEAFLKEYSRNQNLLTKNPNAEWSILFRMLRRPDMDLAAIRAQLLKLGADRGDVGSLDRKILDNLGNVQKLRAVLRDALEDPASQYALRAIASYADGFGDRDLALAAIRKATVNATVRSPAQLHNLLWYPYKTGLRIDPRFKEIVREIGLVDYWRADGNWGDFCSAVGNNDFTCR